jgi:glyoxylate reductase
LLERHLQAVLLWTKRHCFVTCGYLTNSVSDTAVRPGVFATRRFPARVREELERSFELDVHDSEWPPSREQLLDRSAGCDGLMTMLTDRIDDELLDAAGPQLRVVANFAVGFDNVDVPACTRRGVLVSNTPDVLTRATAELAIALMLALVRRVAEGDRLVRRREEWIWAPNMMLGHGLAGRTLGLVGFGRIGQAVARIAAAHGMEVIYTSASGGVPLDQLLAAADVVSLHLPLSAETHHVIDERALSLMKPSAVLVNTSRGPIVDEAALAEAVAQGRIAGAALDVFEREPEVTGALLGLENVVLTPHLGSATLETREAMGMLCVEALRAVLLDGRVPANALNPEALG